MIHQNKGGYNIRSFCRAVAQSIIPTIDYFRSGDGIVLGILFAEDGAIRMLIDGPTKNINKNDCFDVGQEHQRIQGYYSEQISDLFLCFLKNKTGNVEGCAVSFESNVYYAKYDCSNEDIEIIDEKGPASPYNPSFWDNKGSAPFLKFSNSYFVGQVSYFVFPQKIYLN